MRKITIALLFLTLGFGGCTSQQLYDSSSSFRRNLCDDYVGADRQKCLAQANRSYSEYEQGLPPRDAPR